jgi:hypothetical protein
MPIYAGIFILIKRIALSREGRIRGMCTKQMLILGKQDIQGVG